MNTPNRNDPCPCGSGKKYKKCHMAATPVASDKNPAKLAVDKIGEAERLFNAGKWGDAELLCRSVIDTQPGNAAAHFLLGLALVAQGRKQEAIPLYLTAIRLKKDYFQVMGNLGQLYLELGQNVEAEHIFEKASGTAGIGINDKALLLNNLGNALKAQNRLADALSAYKTSLSLKEDHPKTHNNLGGIFSAQNKHEQAISCYRRAIALNPNYAEAYSNLGASLHALGQLDAAVESYQQAIRANPAYAEGHGNLGVTLHTLGKNELAMASFKMAIRLNPYYLDAYKNLSVSLLAQNKAYEAEEYVRKALTLKADDDGCLASLGDVYKGQRNLQAAIDCYRQVIALKPDYLHAYHSLFSTMQFDPLLEPTSLQEAYAAFRCHFEDQLKVDWPSHSNERDAGRKLKIGYVSPDFRRHVVTTFIEPILANHDKSQFQVFCYYNNLVHDQMTERLMGYADAWRNCYMLNDAQLAEQIRADGIDILVDLTGHLAGNRLMVFAHKPAPVQITYLGYPGSSGLSAMDYRLTDHYTDGPGSERYYTEKLLKLPNSLWCYRPLSTLPEVGTLPALNNGFLTFGSFNNFNKMDDGSIALWAKLLQAIPDARLLMVTIPEGKLRQKLVGDFASYGITEDRLTLHGFLEAQDYYQAIQQVDIALDPLVVNGATTTCEVMWMGVPTISLTGERYLSRAGLSILSTAGLDEFAANSPEAYIGIAQFYATDLPRLAKMRTELRDMVANSPLVAEGAFTRNLEEKLLEAWCNWCAASTVCV